MLGFRGIRSVGPRLGVAAPNPTIRCKAADYFTQRANEYSSPLETSIKKEESPTAVIAAEDCPVNKAK